jgi:hypothetical protein
MQIIEVSDLGVRAAVYRLQRRDAALSFLLLPMLHVGEQAYYDDVQRRLAACDAVFIEGMHSRHADRLAVALMLLERHRRLQECGLVYQGDALDLRAFRDRAIYPDLAAEEFDAGWRTIPWTDRLLFFGMVPVVAVALWFVDPRAAIARYMELDDLPSRRDVFMAGDPMDALIVDARDAALTRQLTRYEAEHRADHRLIGVLYGARHMRAVTTLLMERLHYYVADSEWLTVFA